MADRLVDLDVPLVRHVDFTTDPATRGVGLNARCNSANSDYKAGLASFMSRGITTSVTNRGRAELIRLRRRRADPRAAVSGTGSSQRVRIAVMSTEMSR